MKALVTLIIALGVGGFVFHTQTAEHAVTYHVWRTTQQGTTFDVDFESDGGTAQNSGLKDVDWTYQRTTKGIAWLYVSASQGSPGSVSCEVSIDGVVAISNEAHGERSSVDCSGWK